MRMKPLKSWAFNDLHLSSLGLDRDRLGGVWAQICSLCLNAELVPTHRHAPTATQYSTAAAALKSWLRVNPGGFAAWTGRVTRSVAGPPRRGGAQRDGAPMVVIQADDSAAE